MRGQDSSDTQVSHKVVQCTLHSLTRGRTAVVHRSARRGSCACSATSRPTAAMAAFRTLTITSKAAASSTLQSSGCTPDTPATKAIVCLQHAANGRYALLPLLGKRLYSQPHNPSKGARAACGGCLRSEPPGLQGQNISGACVPSSSCVQFAGPEPS